MGSRQQEKSNMTRRELSDAMLKLFLAKGYDETSIKDIAEEAGYSVGSFYRHWKSKQQAFMEFWDEYVSEFIRGSVENAPFGGNMDDMIDFLVRRSEEFSTNEITIKLYVTSHILSAQYNYHDLTSWSERYTQMLYDFIKQTSDCKDERKLVSTAYILNSILNSHAMQKTSAASPRYNIDNDTLFACLKAIVSGL